MTDDVEQTELGFAVADGTLRLHEVAPDGRHRVVAVLGPSDIIDWIKKLWTGYQQITGGDPDFDVEETDDVPETTEGSP